MEKFEQEYRKWGNIVLLSITLLLFTIVGLDAFLGLDLSKNMYVMSVVASGFLLALISLTWITILNTKFMRSGMVKPESSPSEPTVQKGIVMADVEMCIRKEGYVPQVEEGVTFFKISGERVEVVYQDEKFTLSKRYALGDDVDMNLLLKACSQAQDEIFMFRSFIHTYDNGRSTVCFEVETYLNSVSELDRYFPHYLNLMMHAVARQQEIYAQMKESEKVKVDGQKIPASKEPKVVS